MKQDIQAILFDMGGTLRRTVNGQDREKLRAAAAGILELLGFRADVEGFTALLEQRAQAYKQWAEDSLTELGEVDLWTRWMLPDRPAEQVRPLAVQLNQLWREASGPKEVFPETAQVVTELFRHGYRLGLVSNTTSSLEARQTMKALGIFGCFETYVLSCEVGMRKPGPDILLEAVSRMGLDAGQCAYVGDRPDRDVAAARQAGFACTIIHRDPENTEPTGTPAGLEPDIVITNLDELLTIFPRRSRPASRPPARADGPRFNASLSTMWAANLPGLNDFLEAARRLGFTQVELNHRIDTPALAGVDRRAWRFSSVHEPCPADIPVETLVRQDWLPSAPQEENRRQGVAAIRRSIDLAAELGAGLVVVHAGNVSTDRSLENRLRDLFKTGQAGSAEYEELKERMVRTRRELAGPHLAALERSLRELVEHAGGLGVRLGLENRYHYYEIPTPDELAQLLELAGPDRLGFIYDAGHGTALERLGFHPHREWLERFSARILGAHLHDVQGLTDHFAPGLGDVDFDEIGACLPEDAVRTCELQLVNSAEQVRAGLNHLLEHHCIQRIQ